VQRGKRRCRGGRGGAEGEEEVQRGKRVRGGLESRLQLLGNSCSRPIMYRFRRAIYSILLFKTEFEFQSCVRFWIHSSDKSISSSLLSNVV
jgi:hypothetical protein